MGLELEHQPTFLRYLPSSTTTYLPTIPTIFNNNLPSYHTYHLQQQPEMSQISLQTLLLVGAAVDHAVCWSVGDIDPSIAGTYQYVSGAEKLMAQEGTLSDEKKQRQRELNLALPLARLQMPCQLNTILL